MKTTELKLLIKEHISILLKESRTKINEVTFQVSCISDNHSIVLKFTPINWEQLGKVESNKQQYEQDILRQLNGVIKSPSTTEPWSIVQGDGGINTSISELDFCSFVVDLMNMIHN